MDTLKIYATGSANANAAAQVIIPSRSRIRLVQWSLVFTSITAGAICRMELSRASAREVGVNGAQQCISEIGMAGNFVTSGLAQAGQNIVVPLDVAVIQGQIIYLHAEVSGTLTYFCMANIQYG